MSSFPDGGTGLSLCSYDGNSLETSSHDPGSPNPKRQMARGTQASASTPPAGFHRKAIAHQFPSPQTSSATMTSPSISVSCSVPSAHSACPELRRVVNPFSLSLEIHRILSDNKVVAPSAPSTMTTPDPYSADNGGPQNPAREKLVALRLTLLRLHKTLLDMERRDYERINGHVSTGELYRLVIDHEQFAWLHNLSEFVVRLDETLAGETPVMPEDTRGAMVLARKMFAPSESGDAFQKRYFGAIQRDPAVVMEHAELARLFSNEPADASTP
jgi:hypothetical protein